MMICAHPEVVYAIFEHLPGPKEYIIENAPRYVGMLVDQLCRLPPPYIDFEDRAARKNYYCGLRDVLVRAEPRAGMRPQLLRFLNAVFRYDERLEYQVQKNGRDGALIAGEGEYASWAYGNSFSGDSDHVPGWWTGGQ